jgi:cytochrome c553
MRYSHLLFALCLVASGTVAAEEAELVPCLDCHQASTRLGEVPLIAGQHGAYLRAQLQRFRERHRESFPMDALARGFSDATIERKVEEIAGREWQSWPGEPGRDKVSEQELQRLQRGATVAQRFDCATCHGPAFRGGDVIPRIAGQRPGYIELQLKGIAEGRRYHPPTAIGASIDALDAEDRQAVALWLSQLP